MPLLGVAVGVVPLADVSEGAGLGGRWGGTGLVVGWNATLLPIRAFDGDGYGTTFSVSQAIYWAVDNGADIINMSFDQDVTSVLLEMAVSDAAAAGVVMVSAVGNDSSEVETYPSAYADGIYHY